MAEYQQFMMKARPTPAGSTARLAGPTAKNSDCPCGSGKKYKRCCGQGK